MAYSEQHAQIMRDALSDLAGVSEKRMFGGLCFLLNGNMLCGVHQDGGMARVGKAWEAQALALQGVAPLSFTGRRMGGMVEITESALKDNRTRRKVLSLAKTYVATLPPK